MKRKVLKTGGLLLLIALTIANAGLLYYSLKQSKATASGTTLNLAPKATIAIKSAKQHDIDASQQGKLIGHGEYAFDSLAASRIDASTGAGSLVLASYPALGANYVLATSSSTVIDDSVVTSGWQTKTISKDPLWAPGACSSKPTLLLQGRYIFIDDGKTKPTDKYNSYVVFDMQTGKYNYFGGDSFNDAQAKQEKIMLVTDENDQLVFYIDQLDSDGPLANTSSFKHSTDHDRGYVVRRVIDPATMHFTDYKIPFAIDKSVIAGNGTDYYYLSMLNLTTDKQTTPTLQYQNDNGSNLQGTVANNAISLAPPNESQTISGVVAADQGGAFDTAQEKRLNDSLSKALPDFLTGEKYESNYTTNFGVSEVGQHGNTKYIIARSRIGQGFETPAITDKDNTVYPLTTKAFLSFGAYVPLGVF